MADYKRMVSYMYQYENGVKKKNVGYARIEARNGQCKFTLRMQMPGQPDSIFPTYLIHRDDSNTELIYLGDSVLKNNVIDSKHRADEKNINNSGYELSDIGGIVLFFNTDEFFATEWDDKPIIAKEIMAALKPKPNETKKQVKDEGNAENSKLNKIPKFEEIVKNEEPPEVEEAVNIKEPTNKAADEVAKMGETPVVKEAASVGKSPVAEKTDSVEDADRKEEVSKADEIDKKEEPTKADEVIKAEKEQKTEAVMDYGNVLTAAEEAKIPKYKLPRGWKTVERLQNNPYANRKIINLPKIDVTKATTVKSEENISSEEKHKSNLTKEASIPQVTKITQENKIDKNQKIEKTMVKDKGTEVNSVVQEKEAAMDQENVDLAKRPTKKATSEMDRGKTEMAENQVQSNVQASMNRAMKKPNTIPDSPIAARFFKSFPRINPFEDNEIIQCVKIEPKDIGLLPKELWGLSNNSFLLHGYYSYRHLIFAKMMDRSGIRYIIGVPGTYHSKEKFIARMFGFDCFKPAKKRELRQGDFGYWYVAISI